MNIFMDYVINIYMERERDRDRERERVLVLLLLTRLEISAHCTLHLRVQAILLLQPPE